MSGPSSSGAGLRYGALFGLIWGVLLIANYYLVQVQGVRFFSTASLILALVVYLVPGILASVQADTVSAGLLAGLWAGLFSSVLNAVGVTIFLLSDHALVEKIRQAALHAAQAAGVSGSRLTDGAIIVSSVVGLVLGTVVAAAVGVGLGALGGLIGRQRAPRPPESPLYQESMYRGLPPTRE